MKRGQNLHVTQEREDIHCERSSNELPKLLDESAHLAAQVVQLNKGQTTHRPESSPPEYASYNMGAQKRKRSDVKGEHGQDGSARTGPPRKTYKTGKEIQSAIEFASKDCESVESLGHAMSPDLGAFSSERGQQPNSCPTFPTARSDHASECRPRSELPRPLAKDGRGLPGVEAWFRGELDLTADGSALR
jgi:hypothetical protein